MADCKNTSCPFRANDSSNKYRCECVACERRWDGSKITTSNRTEMADYISREAAIDAIMAVYVRTAGYKARERVFEAEEAVHRLPAADVVPVRRGTWKIGRGTDNFDIKCSECGYTDIFGVCSASEAKIEAKLVHYCPNCGARMKVGR